jgi:hypothetical protein
LRPFVVDDGRRFLDFEKVGEALQVNEGLADELVSRGVKKGILFLGHLFLELFRIAVGAPNTDLNEELVHLAH